MIGKPDLELTRQDKFQRPEISDIKDRVSKLETQEPSTIVNASLATMAAATIKGRASGAGTGTPADLTAAQVATIINKSPLTYPLLAPCLAWPAPEQLARRAKAIRAGAEELAQSPLLAFYLA